MAAPSLSYFLSTKNWQEIYEYGKFYYNLKGVINSKSDIQPIIDNFSKDITDLDNFKADKGSDWVFDK